MQQVSLKRIPNYLKARSPQGLRRLMLLNNAKYSTFYEYVYIQFSDGNWYAWFYRDVDGDDIKAIETPAEDIGVDNG